MPLALVTGGAVRLGAATSKALAAAGFDVVVHARRSLAEAEALVQELRDLGRQAAVAVADLATPDGPGELAAQVRERSGALDLLVNNAARYEHLAFEAITRERLEAMLAVNLRAPFLLTQALLPALRAASGCVVNITDMAVSHPYTVTHAFSHYLASKAALEQLTRAWALELGPQVRVNAVAPGPVAMAGETTDEQRQDILRRTPLRREGSPEDIARAVVFLATAPYVTGQTLRVDGGLSVA
ncbi:pteridine reductase [Nannocystis exedens]|uniref:Pteridine reductase n=1 Tax=Nannocystis exedens TaxID=54 RepID=A0A1I2EKJ5_9BACT|nr:SDR family oxidoreductase [Nannocystis exedens]PCC73964.1 short-chain dehydrogenase [Nannocystis exedens]SFE93542.1 pteridine reductase [Nannocystis exedens]